MNVFKVADWVHETSFSCKKEVEKIKDGLWMCNDCLHTARQVVFILGQELSEGFTARLPDGKYKYSEEGNEK